MKTITILVCFSLIASQGVAQKKEAPKKIYFYYLLKWKDSIDVKLQQEALAIFKSMPAKIKGCEKVDVLDISYSTDKFNTAVIMVFNTEEANNIWKSHPDHGRLIDIGLPLINGLSEFEYRR